MNGSQEWAKARDEDRHVARRGARAAAEVAKLDEAALVRVFRRRLVDSVRRECAMHEDLERIRHSIAWECAFQQCLTERPGAVTYCLLLEARR